MSNSWWPLHMSLATFFIVMSLLLFLKGNFSTIHYLLFFPTFIVLFLWTRDVSRESTFQGNHSRLVAASLKWGLVWFLFSEVWFFFGIFWSFFHASMSPITTGNIIWPLVGLDIIPPFQVPLLNTIVLLMSGVTATLSHHEVLSGEKSSWLFYSLLLGVYFLMLQGMEYYSSLFSISSSVFGSLFFLGTGFHGFHVCLGAAMLLMSFLRVSMNKLSSGHHFFLEFSLWYWHFVDVVWLFLFFWVYVWNNF
uniref:Cytochrome c oxidase subunit 3 n=1 Tax=Xiphinema rivesi TaxID=70223 RepID=A0A1P8C789_9BILA|nr:cytochrome c oxidase subunit III [Xiphinema rivesi]AOT84264.1 cytochrome c oxidase subunit III [Xiphinema rivesi]